ncbi:MAG: hypothetical protein FJ253_10075 [Phycisphaerae bacterium]|nr:hypothetical protein [Phycisphaerae bacterium]
MARSKGAIHEDLSRSDRPIGASNFAFGLQIGGLLALVAFALLGLYRWKRGAWVSESGWGPWPWWLLAVGAVVFLLAIVAPKLLTPLNRLWTLVAIALHMIVSPVVMFLLWALVMTPMGWLVRLFGKDLLRMRLDPAARSYWILRDPPGPEPSTMRNQF